MLSALRQLASRVRFALNRRPAPPLDLLDLERVNAILAAAGQPSLTAPPVADPVRGERAMRVFELAPDLREGAPLALTPSGREAFLRWAVFHSSGAHRVSAAEVLALLAHTDRLPDRGLDWTYRLNPAWQQAVPDALTPGGWEKLKEYLRATYGLTGGWVEQTTCTRTQFPVVGRGVNVLAHFDYPSGLQQAADVLVEALHRAGYETTLRDLPFDFRPDPRAARKLGLERFDTTIVVGAVNSFPDEWYRKAGLWMRPGVRRIALWSWELEQVPAEWVPAMQWPDEVWANSAFMADTYRQYVRVPSVPILPGMDPPTVAPLPRSRFGLPDERFVFLFTFDMASRMARKNPLGLIDAFRRAFRLDEPVELVIKTSRGSDHPAEFERLRGACEVNAVRLIDDIFPRAEVLALMNCCDCYVSLHRTEGVGFGMAEAMMMGKPVVATGYSGNLDFMTADTSYLVRAGRVACGTGADPYPPDMLWGDPDLNHAAELLRQVYDNPAESKATGARAARYARELLSIDAYAKRVADALSRSK